MKKQEVKVGDRLKVRKTNKWVKGNVSSILDNLAYLGHGEHSVYVGGKRKEEFEILGNYYLEEGAIFCVPKKEYEKMSHEETRGFIPDYPYVVVKPLTYTAWFRQGVAAIGYDEYLKAGESIEPFRGSKTHGMRASDDAFSFHGALVHHTREVSKEEAELMLKRFKGSPSRREYITTEELVEKLSESNFPEIKGFDFALVDWHKIRELKDVRFVNCSFRGLPIAFSLDTVHFIGCDMRGVRFYDYIARHTISLKNLTVKYCDFTDAQFRKTDIISDIEGNSFKENNFTNSEWEVVKLKNSYKRSYFRSCDFTNARLSVVDCDFGFVKTDLTKASLAFVKFKEYESIDKKVIVLKGICTKESCENLYYFTESQRWVAGSFGGTIEQLDEVLQDGVDADNVAQFLTNHPYNKK